MAVHRMRFGKLRVTLSKNDDNANWYFCCYISEEEKQYRKSTKTANLKDAEEVAHSIVADIWSKQRSGQKVFSVTLVEARKDFFKELDKRVIQGLNKRSAINTIRQVQWGFRFLESRKVTPNTSIDNIKGNIWKDYANWRIQTKPTTQTVIKQELVSIRSMFKHAKDQEWVTDANIPRWSLESDRKPPKRRRVTHQEIDASLKAVARWASNDVQRATLITVLQTMLATGMRTGECLSLKAKDIEASRTELKIHITKSKTGPRTITVMHSGATYLNTYLFITRPEPNDSIFKSHVFYYQLKTVKREGIIDKKFDPYHCRHGFATSELRKGHTTTSIAKHMGTSPSQLEKTYDNEITAMIGRQFAKTKLIYQEDGTHEVVKR